MKLPRAKLKWANALNDNAVESLNVVLDAEMPCISGGILWLKELEVEVA